MFVASYHNTMRSAARRMAEDLSSERRMRIDAQKAAWELSAEIARRDSEHIREMRERAAEQARRHAEELKAQGYCFQRSYASIERIACRVFKVRQVELRSGRRHRHIVLARQFVMYWACRVTTLSLPQIGRLMNGRDHTTVLHGKRIYPEKRAAMGRHLRPLDQRQGTAR